VVLSIQYIVLRSSEPAFEEFQMGLRHFLYCVVTAAWAVTASASQKAPVVSDQQALLDLEQAWNEAFYRKDVAFIENILTDEFMATYDDGSRGDKAKELALSAEFNQQVESAVQDEFTVRVFRDTAVVWFTLRMVGIRQGQRAEMTLRYTDVWVIRDGRWQCVSTQSTRVNPR
jgi:ketosteroid isomerase-like protein